MMNNEAFRALVNKNNNNHQQQRSHSEKSTKEIAREALENEFKTKRSNRHNRGHGTSSGAQRGGKKRGGFNNNNNNDDDAGSDSGSSSNDGNDDDDGQNALKKQQQVSNNDNNELEWKRRRREKRMQDGNTNTANASHGSVEYRDRAKERRMGNNLDYDDTLEGLIADPLSWHMMREGEQGKSKEEMENYRRKQAELSKYLGGDLDHTHLVKGLDKALAEKVRREEMTIVEGNQQPPQPQSSQTRMEVVNDGDDEDDELDRVLENTLVKKEKRRDDWKSLQPKTELGKSILNYLVQKQTSTLSSSQLTCIPTPPARILSAAQKSIQLSSITFSLKSDVRQREKAWEVPRMSMTSSTTLATTNKGRMTPLNNQMIAAISKKLDGRGGISSHSKNKTKYYGSSSSHAEKNEHENVEIEEIAVEKFVHNNTTAGTSSLMKKQVKDDDDSDDDIFANIGNYLPPQTTDTATTPTPPLANGDTCYSTREDTTKKETKKQSIFNNLIPETNSSTCSQKQHTITQGYPQQFRNRSHTLENRNVIDRDIFGGIQGQDNIISTSSQLPYQRRRGPQSAATDGVSMAAYQGGYGEDMDVDFGGIDDDEEDGGMKSDKHRRGKLGGKANGKTISDSTADID